MILGARNADLLMYVDEFDKNANNLYLVTDDGSRGQKDLSPICSNSLSRTEKITIVCLQ